MYASYLDLISMFFLFLLYQDHLCAQAAIFEVSNAESDSDNIAILLVRVSRPLL